MPMNSWAFRRLNALQLERAKEYVKSSTEVGVG